MEALVFLLCVNFCSGSHTGFADTTRAMSSIFKQTNFHTISYLNLSNVLLAQSAAIYIQNYLFIYKIAQFKINQFSFKHKYQNIKNKLSVCEIFINIYLNFFPISLKQIKSSIYSVYYDTKSNLFKAVKSDRELSFHRHFF